MVALVSATLPLCMFHSKTFTFKVLCVFPSRVLVHYWSPTNIFGILSNSTHNILHYLHLVALVSATLPLTLGVALEHTLGDFCDTMIGRADIKESKSNVAMNAWLPQASYPFK